MAMISRSQSGRGTQRSGGADRASKRGHTPKNKDELKSDRDSTMGKNPAAQQDQYGSRHNADKVKEAQRRTGKPRARHDSAFRESAQDVQPDRGDKNKLPGRRRLGKRGSPAR